MTSEQKYQYRTIFFTAEQYDTSEIKETDFRYLLNMEGSLGWRVTSTWVGKQGGQEGIYVLLEKPDTGESPE